jgi:prevent-host-death family protein
MSRKYSITEARASLPAIIDQAEAGQTIELTRRGKPVAAVVSVRELARLRGAAGGTFVAAYRRFLEKHDLEKEGLEEGFAASLRDKGRRPQDLELEDWSKRRARR